MALWTPENVNGTAMAMFYAPAGTTRPTDTVAFTGTLPSPWVNPGGTTEGYTIATSAEVTDWAIEEQDAPVKRRTSRQVAVRCTLAEATLENFKLAIGGGTLASVVGSGSAPSRKSFRFSNTDDEIALMLLSQTLVDVDGDSVRLGLWVPRAQAGGSVEQAFRRLADYRKYALDIAALCPSDEIESFELTAAA